VIQQSSFEYEPFSEPLHISAEQLFLLLAGFKPVASRGTRGGQARRGEGGRERGRERDRRREAERETGREGGRERERDREREREGGRGEDLSPAAAREAARLVEESPSRSGSIRLPCTTKSPFSGP
jgi:hypothetical protein